MHESRDIQQDILLFQAVKAPRIGDVFSIIGLLLLSGMKVLSSCWAHQEPCVKTLNAWFPLAALDSQSLEGARSAYSGRGSTIIFWLFLTILLAFSAGVLLRKYGG